jgi:hypothetical protein
VLSYHMASDSERTTPQSCVGARLTIELSTYGPTN